MALIVDRSTRARHRARWWRTPKGEQRLVGYAFLLPNMVGLALFVVAPICAALYLSMTDWGGIGGIETASFLGVDNYRELLRDEAFRRSLEITAVYTVTFIPLLVVISLGLALLVNESLRFNGFFRSMYFVPFMLSLVVTSVIWTFLLDERSGLVNVVLGELGIAPQAWLGSTALAPWSIVMVTLWQSIGYSMIVFLAGLQDIPRDYYEAATVDGAGAWTRFRTITLPLLRPTTVFVLVIALVGAMQLFDPIFVMTQGGPDGATTTAVYYIYVNAFQFLRFGYASAMAIVLFVILLVATLALLRIFRDGSHD